MVWVKITLPNSKRAASICPQLIIIAQNVVFVEKISMLCLGTTNDGFQRRATIQDSVILDSSPSLRSMIVISLND